MPPTELRVSNTNCAERWSAASCRSTVRPRTGSSGRCQLNCRQASGAGLVICGLGIGDRLVFLFPLSLRLALRGSFRLSF